MSKKTPKVLVVATSSRTRGGITAVVNAFKTGDVWKKYHCRWIETHIDRSIAAKLWRFFISLTQFVFLIPFYDLVHIHFSLPLSAYRKYIFFRIAKLFRKKVIIHLHLGNQIESIWNNLYEKFFVQADVALVLSHVTEKAIKKLLNGKESNIKILYNPTISTPSTDKVSKQPYILFAGTLDYNKGFRDLIISFAKIAHGHPTWKIVFAGNGKIDEGKQLAKELGIETQTLFWGWVNGETKDKLFKEASIFCLPSYAEGFPMAVLDAWAYGLPVIATPVGGLPDVLDDGKNALVFQPGDTEHLAKCLDYLISDEKLSNTISQESLKLSQTVFNIENINKQLVDIYKELLYQ